MMRILKRLCRLLQTVIFEQPLKKLEPAAKRRERAT